MSRKALQALALLLISGLTGTAEADVSLPTLFSDHAVLQRNMPVPVWGTASPGESVEVLFVGQTKTTTADGSGAWRVTLDPMPASPAPGPMTVRGQNTLTVQSVQVGEVWVGSGQSNMFRGISQDAERPLALSEAASLNLSFFNIAAGTPEGTIWESSDATTADAMSAVMFWFGRHLEGALGDVPVGLIHSAVSATAIERWSTAAGNGGLYLDQIKPLQPYAIRGVLWYQGEWDARGGKDSEKYYWQLPALIEEWRSDWGQGNFPFYVVQLPRMGISGVHIVRDAELQTALSEPGVEITVNIDYPEIDVHPSRKEPFGRRLADIALSTIHGQGNLAFGPVYDVAQSYVAGNEIVVGFDHVGGGLAGGSTPLEEWEIAGTDGAYVSAEARIVGDKVVVSSPSVAAPRFVRYAFAPAPANPNLFNVEGLPASPIRELALSANPDTTPPSPDPMTWAVEPYATGSTSIAMQAETASDDSGVEYYFSCISGGCADSGWQDGTVYEDVTLEPDSLYAYTVKARDKSPNQNQTAESAPAQAMTLPPPPPCAAGSFFVSTIELGTLRAGKGRKHGQAVVSLLDDCSDPVALASVEGTFTGDYNEVTLNATDGSGVSLHETLATQKGSVAFTFCVSDAVHGSLTYDPASNAETCESF
jgi:sialate O-acetylesterase